MPYIPSKFPPILTADIQQIIGFTFPSFSKIILAKSSDFSHRFFCILTCSTFLHISEINSVFLAFIAPLFLFSILAINPFRFLPQLCILLPQNHPPFLLALIPPQNPADFRYFYLQFFAATLFCRFSVTFPAAKFCNSFGQSPDLFPHFF
jgi:hypothetical protein